MPTSYSSSIGAWPGNHTHWLSARHLDDHEAPAHLSSIGTTQGFQDVKILLVE